MPREKPGRSGEESSPPDAFPPSLPAELEKKALGNSYNSRQHLTKSTTSARQTFGEIMTRGNFSEKAVCARRGGREI